jgi:hypothetical protein
MPYAMSASRSNVTTIVATTMSQAITIRAMLHGRSRLPRERGSIRGTRGLAGGLSW